MSRLISLLTEKKEPPSEQESDIDIVNSATHDQYSGIGNLFRLLLVVNPDTPIPQGAGAGLINKIFDKPELINTKKSVITKLQTSFNNIKKAEKAGKKNIGVLKKAYFKLLFTILIPLTHHKNFQIEALTKSFSSGSKVARTFQRSAIILIGKSLKAHDTTLDSKDPQKLNTKDKEFINSCINGLEALDSDEPINKTVKNDDTTDTGSEETHFITPPESKEKTTNKIEDSISKVSDERLDDLHQKSGIIMKKVDELQIDNTEEMSNMFETNESPERFKVKLTGNDEAVTDIVNKKIEESFIKVKNKMGLQMANFTSQMASDFFKTLDGKLNGYINAFSDKITIEVEEAPEGIRCKTVISDDTDTNSERFKIDQVFKNGTNEVYLNEVQVPQSAEKMGIFKTLFKKHLESYKAAGIEKISLTANEDVGGYAWFRFGFVPVNQEEIKGIARWIINVAPKVSNVLQYDQVAIGEHLNKCSKTKTTGIKNLVDYLKNEDIHYTKKQPVIISLLEKCSEEFEKTFDGNLSKKEISEYIAYKNFSDITVVGYDGPLAISYKALFKIQGLNDETGTRLIPMLGVHLNWKGDLDLNDMAITNAYLNLK